MLGRPLSRTARLAAIGAALTLTAASAALAAPGTSTRTRTGTDGVAAPRPASRIHEALFGLYALDSQLHAWQARIASLQRAAAGLQQRRAILRQELGAAHSSLEIAQHRLALHLRTLYEQENVDPVAVMLGATTLDSGMRRVDDLRRVADQSGRVAAATAAARRRLLLSRARLAADEQRLARSLAAARQSERSLATAASARLSYVSSLRARERLRTSQVQRVVATAHAAQQKSQRLQPAAPPPESGSRTLVVSATCYDLAGTTATGMPVGIGVVAVDPSVIPLGSRMHVPGYGDGTAADVGGGIKGTIIDLWMPTAQCAAWGRRTVTITLY